MPSTLFCVFPSHPSSRYCNITFILVLAHVMKQLSATVTLREPVQFELAWVSSSLAIIRAPLNSPPRCAAGCVSWYCSPPRFFNSMKMPRLWAPGITRMLVPVNFALNWSKPRAIIPFSGQSTKKAETGGWCDVCSVKNDTFTALFDDVLAALLVGLLSGPCLMGGAVSSTSQIHCTGY